MFTPEKVNLDVKDLKYEFINGKLQVNGKLQERKSFDANGHDYVDLGLPSGTLWAAMNVGANSITDYGLYFQWGDVQGYTAEQVGTGEGQKKFASDWSDYKWYESGSTDDNSIKFKKYATPGAILELEDDATHVNMGGDWHMPTPAQIQELLKYTTRRIVKINRQGIKGVSFKSKNNGKSIFFPAAGSAWDGSVFESRRGGGVWSSVLSEGDVDYGQYLYFGSGVAGVNDNYGPRFRGRSVRGVLAEN